MSVGNIPCPNCRLPLPDNFWNTPDAQICPNCDRRLQAAVFPALLRSPPAARSGETILEAGVASCFHHEGKKAVTSCDGCGRFLCGLCDLEFNGRHLCPTCLDQSRTSGTHVNLETSRIVYDRAALSLALLPLIVWPITMITAPIAVTCGVLSFFKPGSLLGRRPARAGVAIVIGLAQLTGWGAALLYAWR